MSAIRKVGGQLQIDSERRNSLDLEDLEKMDVEEAANLPTELLAALQAEAYEAANFLKFVRTKISQALDLKFGDRAAALRREKSIQSGTVHLADGEFDVVATLPKDIGWDQVLLAQTVDEFRAEGVDYKRYVGTKFWVTETMYKKCPAPIRDRLASARKFGTGRPTYRFKRRSANGAIRRRRYHA